MKAADLQIKIEEFPNRALVRIHITSKHPDRPVDHAIAAAYLGTAIGVVKNTDGFALYTADPVKYGQAQIGIEGRGARNDSKLAQQVAAREFERMMYLARTIVDRLRTVEIPE